MQVNSFSKTQTSGKAQMSRQRMLFAMPTVVRSIGAIATRRGARGEVIPKPIQVPVPVPK